MREKVKIRLLIAPLIILVSLVIFSISDGVDDKNQRITEITTLNKIYEFSVASEREVVEVEPEKSPLTIMYFHLLRDSVDEDTFFRLKEETLEAIRSGHISVIPEGFENKLDDIKMSNSALFQKIQSIDNLIIYEINIENTIIRFKYLKDEERLFSEIRVVK